MYLYNFGNKNKKRNPLKAKQHRKIEVETGGNLLKRWFLQQWRINMNLSTWMFHILNDVISNVDTNWMKQKYL